MSNRNYDKLKKTVTLALPAFGTLYFGLAQIWGFPNGEQVVGTIAVVNVFLGIVLGVSEKSYKKDGTNYGGVLNVDHQNNPDGGPPKKTFLLELNVEPEDLERMDDVTFMINKHYSNKGNNESFEG